MKISSLGEFGLIEQIRKTAARTSKRAPLGIGDDAAALLVPPSSTLLVTTDMLIEGVHFDLATTDLFSLGWKAAAVNLSDIAAMGGVPCFCLMSLGIPPLFTVGQVVEFSRGLRSCLDTYRTVLVGGDTCGSEKGFIISLTVLGVTEMNRVLKRSGAKPGDRIFVTGTLGDSAAGLELLKAGARSRKSGARLLMEKHLRPVARVEWGRKLAVSGVASAMIDVSDGLSSDLAHLCDRSGVGAEVFAGRIPLSPEVRAITALKRKALGYALSGGEDYELLFTVPPGKLKKLRSMRIRVAEIGRITGGRTITLVGENGRETPLQPSGYDHFRMKSGARSHR